MRMSRHAGTVLHQGIAFADVIGMRIA